MATDHWFLWLASRRLGWIKHNFTKLVWLDPLVCNIYRYRLRDFHTQHQGSQLLCSVALALSSEPFSATDLNRREMSHDCSLTPVQSWVARIEIRLCFTVCRKSGTGFRDWLIAMHASDPCKKETSGHQLTCSNVSELIGLDIMACKLESWLHPCLDTEIDGGGGVVEGTKNYMNCKMMPK